MMSDSLTRSTPRSASGLGSVDAQAGGDAQAQLRLITLTASLSRRGAGVFEVTRCLSQALSAAGIWLKAIGLRDDRTDQDLPSWLPLRPDAFRRIGPASVGYAPGLVKALCRADADVVHCHGLWMYPSRACYRWGRITGRPYVVAPHGMLDPWALGRARWKKRLAALGFQNAHLREAACLHALCPSEAQSIRAYGLRNPICVVRNGVDIPEKNVSCPPPWAHAMPDARKTVLFLGRLHPKKNLQNLLEGWAQVARRGGAQDGAWQLVIAGWDQGGHEGQLKHQARELGVADSVCFTGPLFDQDKAAALASASLFVLPSFSEGLPLAILEAWAYGLPVLMTPHCNLPEGFTAGAALQIGSDPGSIAAGLDALMTVTDAKRQAMGSAGRRLVQEQFTWARAAAQLKRVYEWILGCGTKPECVLDG